jgi:SAM-dependent methyltransferase
MPNTPTSLMLDNCAELLIGNVSKVDFLEVGVGAGDFIRLLGRRGFSGQGIDLSADAVNKTRALIEKHGFRGIDVRQADIMTLSGKYRTIFIFEVLEHISDDKEALIKLFELLTPGGFLILSVPAHQSAWGANDDLAGHLRRYEKVELKDKLEEAGFNICSFWSGAYPVGNIFKILRDKLEKNPAQQTSAETARDRTINSGVIKAVNAPDRLYSLLFNKVTLWPALLLQRLFFSSDLGLSYVVKAQKPGPTQ